MSTKPQISAKAGAMQPARRGNPEKGKAASGAPAPSPERGRPNPDDPRRSRHLSEPHMKKIGGSGLARWDDGLLLRTMHTVRPPTLREGETEEEAKLDIAACAGIGIEAFAPQDAVEAMIASQAVALHFAAMECARRAMLPQQSADVASRLRKDTANLSRAMVDMTEALQRRRGKGGQVVRVERVMVGPGGQAIVGAVSTGARLPAEAPAPQAIAQDGQATVVPIAVADTGEGEA